MNGLEIFKGVKFYRQSGTLGRYQLMMVARCCKEIRRYLPYAYDDFFLYWTGEHADWYFQEEKMRGMTKAFLAVAGIGIPVKWQEDWRGIDKELTEASRRIRDIDLSTLSLEDLQREYGAMFELKKRMWAAAIFIDAFDLGDDLQEIARIQKNHNFSEHETQILLSPRTPAYITEWENALVAVREGKKAAKDVAYEYFWMGTDYFNCNEMDATVVVTASAKAHAEAFASPAVEQRQILTQHNLAQNPLGVFETLTEWRDIRKRLNFTALYGLCRILKEVLRRKNIPQHLLRWMLPHEAEGLFGENLTQAQVDRIAKRGGATTFVHIHADANYTFSEEAEADLDYVSLVGSHSNEEVREIKGTVASRGKAVGIVRNIKTPDAPSATNFEMGDILVTAMTRPEFVPLMRLAGGIITDEGGITSHAAIVSRELKKPCIIGTKIGTQVLKDGDEVEVDAENGIVRLLR